MLGEFLAPWLECFPVPGAFDIMSSRSWLSTTAKGAQG
jgi:hypothetical protein